MVVLLISGAAGGAGDGPGGEQAPAAPATKPAPAAAPRILIYSRTAGFRHASIPDGIICLRELGAGAGIEVESTEDPAAFTDENLRRFRAVVFLSTTGDILEEAQQQAFERFIRAGGGWVGIHAAADTEYEWPWYGKLVGAWFKTHPPVQPATVVVEERSHPSTRMLPARWERTDEWYGYRSNPRQDVQVLMSLDETTYKPGESAMAGDHPIAWCHTFDGGRAWYTGGGHTRESFQEPLFRDHLLEGIRWAAGLPAGAAVSAPATPAGSGPSSPR